MVASARTAHALSAMTSWLFVVLALFVLQTLLPASLRYRLFERGAVTRLRSALGPRDDPPAATRMGARAQRALVNLQEALWVFVPLALLHATRAEQDPTAIRGATIFTIARACYLPAYLSGLPGPRSALWIVSWVGLSLMIVGL
ncbi:MAG: MAPEG family protein [Nannocystaceae bacterium]|nr:MAPEG family protein [Nannocystaceae bacterium]